MKPIYLKQVACVQCDKKIVAINAIRWSGQYYGKGCFNKHIKPTLLAKKLDDKNFYNVTRKTVISLIAEMTIGKPNYFTDDIQFKAQKGFISFQQESVFYVNTNVVERVKLISDLTDIMSAYGLNKEKARYLHEFYYRMLNEFISGKALRAKLDKSESKEESKVIRGEHIQERVTFEYELMKQLNELYQTNENFKEALHLYHGDRATTFVEFLSECGGFSKETQDKLDARYDKLGNGTA